MDLPFLNANHITSNIRELYFNNSFGITINYLKQAIDIAYSMQMAQDVRLLKVCNFCNNVRIKQMFIKAETNLFLKMLYKLKKVFLLKFLASNY